MEMPVLPPDQFMLVFPCFALMSKSCRGGVIDQLDYGGIALIVFSDEDLVRDYRAKNGSVGPTIKFDFAEQLGLFLHSLRDEVTHVSLDPSEGKPRLFLLDDVIRKIIG